LSGELRDLTKLVHPFPQRVIHTNPSGGGVYVKHTTVAQRILDVIGPHNYRVIEVIRGHVDGKPGNPNGSSPRAKAGTPDLTDAVVAVRGELTLEVDGRRVQIVEVGDCEQPHNWPHDGARLKDAASDAYKRCAMRVGVGLHLWAQEDFYLSEKLLAQDSQPDPETPEVTP
jgi:hypothetical protein